MGKHEDPLLRVRGLVSGYGKKRIINEIDLHFDKREIVTLIGHNGAGKSTLLKAIFGLLPVWGGEISFLGRSITGISPVELIKIGIVYVPQGGRIFRSMSVKENLEVAIYNLCPRKLASQKLQEVFQIFPLLKDRLSQTAGLLSGGERQALALARSLITSPRLLMLDEPSLGLSPAMTRYTLGHIGSIKDQFGVTIVLVEQKVREALRISDRVYVLKNGIVSYEGRASDLADETILRRVYF